MCNCLCQSVTLSSLQHAEGTSRVILHVVLGAPAHSIIEVRSPCSLKEQVDESTLLGGVDVLCLQDHAISIEGFNWK